MAAREGVEGFVAEAGALGVVVGEGDTPGDNNDPMSKAFRASTISHRVGQRAGGRNCGAITCTSSSEAIAASTIEEPKPNALQCNVPREASKLQPHALELACHMLQQECHKQRSAETFCLPLRPGISFPGCSRNTEVAPDEWNPQSS